MGEPVDEQTPGGWDGDGTDGGSGGDGTDGSDGGGRDGGSDGGGKDMTLAFDLAAAERLLRPRRVFADAGAWSRYAGIVDDDEGAVAAFEREWGLRQDFEVGELTRRDVLAQLRWEAGTERYVLVGTDERTRELADHVGWEYLPVEEAAAEAGWTLREEAGPVARLRASLARRVLSAFRVERPAES